MAGGSHNSGVASSGAGGVLSRRSTMVLLALVLSTASVSGVLMATAGDGSASAGRSIPVVPLMRHARLPSVEGVLRTDASLDHSRWSSIVIHHSSSPAESPGSLDSLHRSMGLASLGYHFVIGNGRRMGDGELHIGPRWLEQLPGAHVMGPAGLELNRHAVGICLVGDGDARPFSDMQLRTLLELVAKLRGEFGIGGERVLLHSDVAATTSPGRYFPAELFPADLSPSAFSPAEPVPAGLATAGAAAAR